MDFTDQERAYNFCNFFVPLTNLQAALETKDLQRTWHSYGFAMR
ncbi:MAG: hypothetical protein ABIF10_04790 [Candidatus Woesearchaeota archaeon]